MTIPLFARKFILDATETGLGLVFALTVAFPTTLADGKAVGIAVGGALLSAVVSAGRRALPGFVAYLAGVLNVSDSTPPTDGNG